MVYADDQFVNQHTVAKNFEELNIPEKLITFSNGQDVLEYFEKVVEKVIEGDDLDRAKRPV